MAVKPVASGHLRATPNQLYLDVSTVAGRAVGLPARRAGPTADHTGRATRQPVAGSLARGASQPGRTARRRFAPSLARVSLHPFPVRPTGALRAGRCDGGLPLRAPRDPVAPRG